MLVWADEANLSARTETAIEDAYTQWYDNLSDLEQEGFAEAWPMIKDDAAACWKTRTPWQAVWRTWASTPRS